MFIEKAKRVLSVENKGLNDWVKILLNSKPNSRQELKACENLQRIAVNLGDLIKIYNLPKRFEKIRRIALIRILKIPESFEEWVYIHKYARIDGKLSKISFEEMKKLANTTDRLVILCVVSTYHIENFGKRSPEDYKYYVETRSSLIKKAIESAKTIQEFTLIDHCLFEKDSKEESIIIENMLNLVRTKEDWQYVYENTRDNSNLKMISLSKL
ncbi:MAG: hypothetical protein MCSN_2060 [Candidatus Microsyncoccus archaeolyticus]|nr:MAG: hypothetical protein MCSN_2060 [Candidatus Parcubacteria bacterium]